MPSHNILHKTDLALVAWIINQGAGTANDTFPLKSSLDKPLPVTICHSAKATPIDDTGNWSVQTTIYVHTSAAVDVYQTDTEPPAESADLAGDVCDCFVRDGQELASDITIASNYSITVMDISVKSIESGFADKDMAWTDTIDLELVVCPAVIAD